MTAATSTDKSSDQAAFRAAMPGMMRHEGVWEGVYRHLGPDAELVDQHDARIECIFPASGPHVYVQQNTFTWPDGAVKKATLPAIFRDGKLWWDVETFSGWAWETAFGLVLLNLARKDDPGANFFEMIALGESGLHRARTWHWFKDGALTRRTLCDEIRVDG